MAFYRCGGGGIPSSLKTDMNTVYNKKFGTSTTYDPSVWASTANLMGPLPERTATGSIAHITDGADEVPIKSWEVEIAPTLTGKSAIECTQTGKNLIDLSSLVDGYVNSNGTFNTNHPNGEMRSDFIPVLPNTVYYFSIVETTETAEVWVGIGEYTDTNTSSFVKRDGYWRFTTSATTKYVVVSARNLAQATKIQLEIGNDQTTWEAYTPIEQYTASLGRTIYGGTVDVVKGEGTETEKGKWLSELSWTQNATFPHVFNGTGFTDRKKGINWNNSTCFSDRYTGYTSSEVGSKSEGIALATGATNTTIYVSDDRFSTVAEFTQSLETDDSFVVLPLDTATDFTFTPITPTPETALGVNNFWADEGDSEVTYRADINLAMGGQ